MLWFRSLVAIAIALPMVAACGDDDDEPSFRAELSGDEEVPPVPTTATGSATLSLDGDRIDYTVQVSDLENPLVAHIHVAPTGQNGPVRMDLCGTGAPIPDCVSGDGVLATGSNGTIVGGAISFDSLVSAMRAGNAYVNVHTDDGVDPQNTGAGDMASGEIRGQISTD